MVDVSNKYKSITVSVSSKNGNTVVAASSDTAQYWANQSHTFANQSKDSVQEAKHYAELANSYIEGFEDVVTNNTNNIIATSNDCINQLTELKETGAVEINEAVASGKDEINSTKTTILNDIEFVADGEKEEIRDIIDTGKDELKEAIGDVKVLTTLDIGDIGIAPLGIDETKGKRRYLNGQLIIQEQYAQFTNKVKSAVALYPSLACTESEWQTTATMTVGGQVGKFVIDDNAGTIRLPKVVNIQGLTDLSKLGEIVEAGLPNITGASNAVESESGGTGGSGALYTTWSFNGWAGGANGGRQYVDIKMDASRSNSIYGNSTTVQQEQIQYPYFIQVATGAETEDNIINEIELNNPYSFGDSKYSPLELNNLSWLKSEGQWNSKAVYPSFYDWALTNFNNGIEGFALSTDEYTDYDVVINTAEETFRLPLLDGSENLPSDKFDNLTLLPSESTYTAPANGWYLLQKQSSGSGQSILIENQISGLRDESSISTTANQRLTVNSFTNKGETIFIGYASSGATNTFRFIYAQGNGSLYFYVGETVQNANLINAGRIEEKLVDKVDTNASNFTVEGKSLISGLGFPSNKYIDLVLGASGTTYTAPANGYVCIAFTANTSGSLYVYVNRIPRYGQYVPYNNGAWVETMIPVQKGEPIAIQYSGNPTVQYFNFIYPEGEV